MVKYNVQNGSCIAIINSSNGAIIFVCVMVYSYVYDISFMIFFPIRKYFEKKFI